MQKELVKSKAPRRWMAVFLALLAVGAVALALLWTRESNAVPAPLVLGDSPGFMQVATQDLRCEMVRVWPLPSECLFLFGGGASGR
mgnify:CR=1 FL=1